MPEGYYCFLYVAIAEESLLDHVAKIDINPIDILLLTFQCLVDIVNFSTFSYRLSHLVKWLFHAWNANSGFSIVGLKYSFVVMIDNWLWGRKMVYRVRLSLFSKHILLNYATFSNCATHWFGSFNAVLIIFYSNLLEQWFIACPNFQRLKYSTD